MSALRFRSFLGVAPPEAAVAAGGVWAVALVRTVLVALVFSAATFASPAETVTALAVLLGILVGGAALAVEGAAGAVVSSSSPGWLARCAGRPAWR